MDDAPWPVHAIREVQSREAGRTPPHSLEAEKSILGAAMLTRPALEVLVTRLRPEDFYQPAHGHIAEALGRLYQEGAPVDLVTVADALERFRLLEGVGGRDELRRLQAQTPAAANADRYAQIVAGHSRRRQLIGVASEIVLEAYDDDVDPARAAALLAEAVADYGHGHRAAASPLLTAAEFLYGPADRNGAIHGREGDVLHSSGEPTLVVAVTGVGKSTYAQNYACHRLGLLDGDFLGLPVAPLPEDEAVLYVAADRPKQIRRSFRRLIGEDTADALAGRLRFHPGPLPFLLNAEPLRLAAFVAEEEQAAGRRISDVILDSLKDVALGLATDENGAPVAAAMNRLVADGRELIALHHERKPPAAAKKAPATIGDIYGSTFLTASAGNVVYLHGQPGAYISTLHHLKHSADQVGPLEIHHDHDTGILTVARTPDLLHTLRHTPKGLAVKGAALVLWGDSDPEPNTMARAYRKLERLVAQGLARREGGGRGFDQPATYYATETRHPEQP